MEPPDPGSVPPPADPVPDATESAAAPANRREQPAAPPADRTDEGDPPDPDAAPLIEALDSTAVLLGRIKNGDRDASNLLFERYWRILLRMAHGRLPMGARGMLDTQDLAQDVMTSVVGKINGFEYRHPGGFLGFLRETLLHRVIDEARRAGRRPVGPELTDEYASTAPSPLQVAMGREEFERYDRALNRLSPVDKDAIIYRLELHFDYKSVAKFLGKPNQHAARQAVRRAVERLMEQMDNEG